MAKRKIVEELRGYLYGPNKNLVEAAFVLQELSESHRDYRGNPLTGSYGGLYDSHRRIGSHSSAMLKELRGNRIPGLEDLAKLEKYFDGLEKDARTDDEMYGADRRRISREISEQEWRDNHTNYWTGEPCPKGPD